MCVFDLVTNPNKLLLMALGTNFLRWIKFGFVLFLDRIV